MLKDMLLKYRNYFTIVIIYASICQHSLTNQQNAEQAFISNISGFRFKYHEHYDLAIPETINITASHAVVGDFPHWCLGNVHICSNGFSIDFWIKTIERPGNSPDITILSNGGNTFHSDGFYMVQKFGDQYEVGVTKNTQNWQVNFRLVAEFYIHVLITWDENLGLKTFVDEHEFKQTKPEEIVTDDDIFDVFSIFGIGFDQHGEPILEDEWFQILSIDFHDRVILRNESKIDPDLVYLGCYHSSSNIQGVVLNETGSRDIIQKCRHLCTGENGLQVSLINADNVCSCGGKGILSHVVSSNETCSGGQWQVFFASGLTGENPYFIDVSVHHLTSRDYVKPSETVMIKLKTNLDDSVAITVDMGDGVKIITFQREIYHYWYQEGNYSISAAAKVGSISVVRLTYFVVEDVDEGISPEVVHIAGYHMTRNLVGTFEIAIASNYSTTCSVDFGDGTSPNRLSASDGFVSNKNVGHMYIQLGLYNITATCNNAYGDLSYSTVFLAKDFDLLFDYFSIGLVFNISFASGFDYGNLLNVKQNDDHQALFMDNDGDIAVPLTRPYENLISFDIGAETVQKRIFYVQSKLKTPHIVIEELASAWTLTTNVTILVPPGFQTFVNCTFGLFVDEMFYVFGANDTVALEFTINYSDIGYYSVIVNTFNDISDTSRSELISVEVPIVSIGIETKNILDKTLPVELNISLNMGADGPQKVKFRIDHADGKIIDYNYFSSSKNFTTYQNNYIYSDWGVYRICVTAINKISNVTACTKVQVGQNMTYNDLQTDTNARATTRDYAEVTITSIAGSDRVYYVDFGDEFPFTITDTALELGQVTSTEYVDFNHGNTDGGNSSLITSTVIPNVANTTILYLTTAESLQNYSHGSSERTFPRSYAERLTDETILVRHMYPRPGKYRARVTVQNEFSLETKHLCPTIIVDDTDISNCNKPEVFFKNIEFNETRSYERVRSEQIDIVINASSTCSDRFRYSWRTTRLLSGYYKTFGDICTTDVENNTLRIPPVSLEFGYYRIVVTVSPVGFPLATIVEQINLVVIPSHPVAHIDGDDEMWFLTFGSTTIDFKGSRDPDLKTNIRKGLSYDLFCMPDSAFPSIQNDDLETLKRKSAFVVDDILFGGKTKNPARFYDHANCLDISGSANVNATTRMSLSGALFNMPSRFFSSESPFKRFVLYVTKQGRTSKTNRKIELRVSNSTDAFSELDALLAKKDVAGVLAAVSILTSGIDGDDNSTSAQEAMSEMKEKLVNYVDEVADKVQNVGQCKMAASAVTGLTEGDISMKTRSKGSNAIAKTASSMSSKFGEEPMSTLTDVASAGLNGISNVLPKESTEDQEKERKRNKRKLKLSSQNDLSLKIDPCSVETKVPDFTGGNEIVQEEELDDFDNILRRYDLQSSEELLNFYDCLWDYPKAFRGAVRKYGRIMWFPLSLLEIGNEEIFSKYAVEWEPFDVDEYINVFCMKEIRRLNQEKLDADKDVAQASMNAIGDVSNLMLGKMEASRRRRRRREAIGNGTDVGGDDDDDDSEDVDQSLTISAASVAVQMQNIDPNAEGEQAMGTDSGGAKLDSSLLNSFGGGGGCSVGATVVVNENNPYTFSNKSDSAVNTKVVSIDLTNPCTGEKAAVQNTSKPIVIEMDGNPDKIDCPMQFLLCLSRRTSGVDPTEFNYHPVQVDTNDSTIHFTVWPDREGDRFKLYIKYEDYPNATYYDYSAIIPHDKDAFSQIDENLFPKERRYLQNTFFPPQNLTRLNGTYRIAIKLHEKTTVNFEETEVCLNYSTQLMISGCKFWSDEEQAYKGDGLKVSNETTMWKTKCLSTHLTSFGGDFAVPPNTIDFSNVWAKFDLTNNAGVFSTVIVLIGLYIIIVIWGRHMDKKDLLKWGATPLEDNLPTDNYHYQITVQTGIRKKAGTTSKVSFVLSGEENDCGARRLFDGQRKTFVAGSILNYILSVEQCLGPLSFLRVWHDNSGKGKMRSWYLDQIQVNDLQTGERYFFLCDRWFAVEEDDGMIDRILPVAGREDLAAFKHLFSSSIRKKLTSDHLWFSVFSRPTRSNFTRVQRISCCMSLLFMTMITNAMWFKSEDNTKQTNALQIGPVSFTLQQVFVSFASTMLVFPVNFIIITFFRRCRPKKNAVMQINQRMPKRGKWKNVTSSSQIWGNAPKKSTWQKFKSSVEAITTYHQRSKYGAEDIDPEEEDKPQPKIVGLPDEKQAKKKKKPGTFPHWCIYIAYALTVLSIIVPGFFTILYSMEWGPEKANEWLTTFIMSFFQSVIVVQPIKVMILVAFIACILKKPDVEEEDGAGEDLNNVIAAHDEEMLHKDHAELDEIVERRRKANENCKPLDMESLNKARETRMMEIKMETVLREIAIYILFILILFFLSYQNRDSNSYAMAENLKAVFDNGFSKISTTEQYWKWVEKKLIPSMYASKYHNGTEIKRWWDKRCVADLESRRVGIPRLRQLRVKPDTCTINPKLAPLINHCRDEYGWTDDNAKHYNPGWVPIPEENITMAKEAKSPWLYRNSIQLANAPYVGGISTYKGGGYVYLFKRNVERLKLDIKELRENVWLDVHTRGLFLEFTVYNPNVNLFGSMIMLVEFMKSGGAVTRMEFKIFRLLSYIGGMGVLVLIFEILYGCFSLYFFIRFVRKFKKEKKKYFSSFWNKLEFVLMVFCITVIAMFAFKKILTSIVMDALKDRKRADNVNFQSMAMYDELYGYMIGIVVFLATIQFLKLLQFNKKMNMLGDTVELASKDLKVFSFAFIIYFLAFTMFAFLLFGSTLYEFSGFISSAESMFAFTLGSFDFEAMESSQKILGPIFFFLFIFIVYVGLMSIFLTIIADAFNTVKEDVANQTNDYEIVDFMWQKIKGVIG